MSCGAIQLIIGAEWSRRNAVFPGDKLDLIGPAAAQAIMEPGEPGKSRALSSCRMSRSCGACFAPANLITILTSCSFRLKWRSISTAWATRAMARASTGSQCGCATLLPRKQLKQRLNRELPPNLYARTWMDDNRDLFNAIATERVVMSFILYFVLLVAAFGLCSTLITITVQKSREIGLMKALGANDLQVCLIFILHSAIVGVVGAIGGTACGLLMLHYRNSFRQFLLTTFHVEVFPSSVYSFSDIPAIVNPTLVAEIAVSAVVACVLAALIPAINVVRIAPARALRYE